MIYNRFQGDPAVKITPDGAKMKFVGGQPVMDQGIENAVTISMYTKKGWWGNILFSEESKKIGSDVQKTAGEPIVNLTSVNNVTDSIEKALAWMINSKLASSIDIEVTNPKAESIKANITVHPPGRDAQKFLFLKNGLNWVLQSQNPAHERMADI